MTQIDNWVTALLALALAQAIAAIVAPWADVLTPMLAASSLVSGVGALALSRTA